MTGTSLVIDVLFNNPVFKAGDILNAWSEPVF